MTAASSRWDTVVREASDPPAVSRRTLPSKPKSKPLAKDRGAYGFALVCGNVAFHFTLLLLGGMNLYAHGRPLPEISMERYAFSIHRRFPLVLVQRRQARPSGRTGGAY